MSKIPFISYAHEDAATAKRLYGDLLAAGAAPWLDTEKLLGGQDWEAAIRIAIREATHFIALISKNSVNKRGFVQKELRQALEVLAEFPPGQIFVIPVRLDDSHPKDEQLGRLHRIDLFPDYARGLKAVCKSLGIVPVAAKVVAALRDTRPRQEIPTAVIDRIRAQAATRFPDDFSTQKFVIETEMKAWQEFNEFSTPGVPEDIVRVVLDNASKQFPDDFGTRVFVANNQIEAWRELQTFTAPDMPEAVLQTIATKAAHTFGDDFVTRIFVMRNEISAWKELHL